MMVAMVMAIAMVMAMVMLLSCVVDACWLVWLVGWLVVLLIGCWLVDFFFLP